MLCPHLPLSDLCLSLALSLSCLVMDSGDFLVLYCIALATAGWGVVASLEIYPPFAGAAVSAVTLVVAFGFAISRPQITLKVLLCVLSKVVYCHKLSGF